MVIMEYKRTVRESLFKALPPVMHSRGRHAGFIFLFTILICGIVMSGCKKAGVMSTATYEMTEEINGVTLTDTVSLEAEDDKLTSLTEIFSYDMTSADEDTQTEIASLYDGIVAQYQTVDGVICNGSEDDGIYTINLYTELDTKTVEALSELGLISVSGDVDEELSYSLTKESLAANGYTIVSEVTE